jgi:predicted MFS family arabinose efflux permease
MTGLGAAALNFVTLLMVRAGVAVGEAGCNPTTQSLLADYFPPERRGFAQGVLVTAIPISSLLALVIGGLVAQAVGWRWTLVIIAIPGLLLAPVVLRLLPEPRRGRQAADRPQSFRIGAELRVLTGRPILMMLIAAATCGSVHSYAMLLWGPSLFIRSYGWSLATAGVGLGFAVGVGGVLGSLFAGRMADRLRREQFGGQLLISAGAAAVSVPLLLLLLLSSSAPFAIGAFFALQVVSVASSPALFAALQDFAPERNRALAFALMSIAANLACLIHDGSAVGCSALVLTRSA